MKNEMRKITLALGMLLCIVTIARENVNVEGPRTTRSGGSSEKMKFGSDCDAATQSADLDITLPNGKQQCSSLNNSCVFGANLDME